MVQVENGVIVQYSLPKVGKLKDGTSISGYDLYMISNPDIAKAEGWLPLIDEQPEYNPETQYLMLERYDILEDSVVVIYKIEDYPVVIPESPTPSIEERLQSVEKAMIFLTLEGGGI